jgi:hypothetical protein
MVLEGVSGAIDHVAAQPFLGLWLNFFDREIVSRVGPLAEHALFANLILAVIGLVVCVAAGDVRS